MILRETRNDFAGGKRWLNAHSAEPLAEFFQSSLVFRLGRGAEQVDFDRDFPRQLAERLENHVYAFHFCQPPKIGEAEGRRRGRRDRALSRVPDALAGEQELVPWNAVRR